MSHRKVWIFLVLLVCYVVVAVATSVTLSPQQIEEMKKKATAVSNSEGGKNMKEYIAEIWESKIIPEFDNNAMELDEVIARN